MSQIVTETVELAREDARSFDAYVARPAQPGPGIVILSEMFGMNEPMRQVARDYAERGFLAILPNLFWRSAVTRGLGYDGEDREIAWQRLRDVDFDAAGIDIATSADWLRAQPDCTGKVGAIGFCAGGRMAFIAAARGAVDAAVSFYALGIPHHLDEIGAISCPVQLHYGLADQHIPLEEIRAVEAACAAAPTVETYLYEGAGHSFYNPVRPGYHAVSAELAHERLAALFESLR